MIDRNRRDQYAELLRHFSAGLVTNTDYEERADKILGDMTSKDAPLNDIFYNVWTLYSDIDVHKLTGRHALLPETREMLARTMMFLYSDFEYAWKSAPIHQPASCLQNMATFGLAGLLAGRRCRKQFDEMRCRWPVSAHGFCADGNQQNMPDLVLGD